MVGSSPAPGPELALELELEPLAPGTWLPVPFGPPPAATGPPWPPSPLLAEFVIAWRSFGTAKVTETTSSSAPAAASAGRSHACAERAWPACGRSRARSRDSSSDSPLAMTASSLAITLTRVAICRGM
jgi:hypothetical protein